MSPTLTLTDTYVHLEGFTVHAFKSENCTVYIKGALHLDNELVEPEKWSRTLVDQLLRDEDGFGDYLAAEMQKATGMFTLVIQRAESLYLAVDRVRSTPVFFGNVNDHFVLSNNLDLYQKTFGALELDDQKVEEFIASGYAYGSRTLFKNLSTLRGGEIVVIRENQISRQRYFEFRLDERQAMRKDKKGYFQVLNKALESGFRRMIEQTPNVNRWVIPLSGGHDSRTAANFLHRLGQKNVICYSYGKPENIQMSSSRAVATTLGYDWHFVEHTEEKWLEVHKKGVLDEYIDFAFNGTSTPHLQDFLAVYQLKEQGILQPGDVIVPGHTNDFVTGNSFHESDMACENKEMAVDLVMKRHLRKGDYSPELIRTLEEMFDESKTDPKYFQEYFNWQELRGKFTLNSLRTYEFFGFDFRIPFWDKEIIEFWLRVPDKKRTRRNLSFELEQMGILDKKIASIPFGGKSDRSGKNKLTDLLVWILPGKVKTSLLRLTGRKIKMNEALNQIYALRAPTVKELLDPVEDFPRQTRSYFDVFLKRYPHQTGYHFLTSLYTIRRQLNRY